MSPRNCNYNEDLDTPSVKGSAPLGPLPYVLELSSPSSLGSFLLSLIDNWLTKMYYFIMHAWMERRYFGIVRMARDHFDGILEMQIYHLNRSHSKRRCKAKRTLPFRNDNISTCYNQTNSL